MRARRSSAVVLGLTASVALAVSGCAASGGSETGSGSVDDSSVVVQVDPGSSDGSSSEVSSSEGDVVDEEGNPVGVSDGDYVAVCTNPDTDERVDDAQCADAETAPQDQQAHRSSSGMLWYFLAMNALAPRIGGRVTGGGYVAPAGASVFRGAVPTTGGRVTTSSVRASAGSGHTSVSRGGFGGSGAKAGS